MQSPGGLMILLAMNVVATGQEPVTEAHGTVNELMIGIIEPSTNVIGNAAFEDPAAPTDESIFDPYGGWLKVQTAAIAMAESANLLTIPGRVCSNGRKRPVKTVWRVRSKGIILG